VFIWAELAGVEKEHLEIEVNSKAVRIHGLRKELPKPAEGAYRLAEIRYGRFERVIYLPSPIDPEVVSSNFTDGFLSMRMLKAQKQKTHKDHHLPMDNQHGPSRHALPPGVMRRMESWKHASPHPARRRF
jgi:HSP20 family molecular chaperone IbpA